MLVFAWILWVFILIMFTLGLIFFTISFIAISNGRNVKITINPLYLFFEIATFIFLTIYIFG